jgi:hypothetical protein
MVSTTKAVSNWRRAAHLAAPVVLSVASSLALAGNFPSVERARVDLADRLQTPLEKVLVIEQVEKTWPDSSLGCPKPGMAYRQVLVNGSRLMLEVAGRNYNYHAGSSRDYFYCAPRKGNSVFPTKKKSP